MRLALPIDPMLAAEMIYRASSGVWELVQGDITAFVARWHKPGTVDRAVRFMITTGRPEFAPEIWPLAANRDTQTQISTLRTTPRFRPRVLGPDFPAKLDELPEEAREHLLALIAAESGVDGMDSAVELAKPTRARRSRPRGVQALQFRRAERHVADLLSAAHQETWALIAARGYAEDIGVPAIAVKLRALMQIALEQATEPSERLRLLLVQPADFSGRDAAITAAIADPGFPVRGDRGGSLYFAEQHAPVQS